MRYLYEILLEVLKVLIGLGVAGSLAYYFAYRELARRTFWGRVTFSLFTFRGDSKKINIDTLLDLAISDVWVNNRVLLRKIQNAAEECNPQSPWIWIDGPEMYHVKSGLRHQLSSRFSDGALHRAMGGKVEHETFLVCLCAVHSTSSNTHKLRAFVLKESFLRDIGQNVSTHKENNPGKEAIIDTMNLIWLQYQNEKKTKPKESVVHHVRIYQRLD